MQGPECISDKGAVHTGCAVMQASLHHSVNFGDVLYFSHCSVADKIGVFFLFSKADNQNVPMLEI